MRVIKGFNCVFAVINYTLLMDFHLANKKSKDPIHSFKKYKLLPLTTHKYRKQTRVEAANQPRDPRIATFDSLQVKKLVCCEGIKLGNRQNKSVQKRRKVEGINQRGKRQSINQGITLLKMSTTINNASLEIKSILIKSKAGTTQLKPKFNPEDMAHLRKIPAIDRSEVVISKKEKKDLLGFLKADNLIVTLHRYEKSPYLIDSHPYLLQPHSIINLESASYLIVDQCDCQTLKSLILQFGKLNQTMVIKHLRQILSAVFHLQKNGLSHNRINLQSLLHNRDGDVLVNWAKSSNKPVSEEQKQNHFHYFSPELLTSKNCDFGEKADVWAIGCVALELLSLSPLKINPLHPYNRSSKIYRNPSSEKTIQAVQKLISSNIKPQKTQLENLQKTSLREQAKKISASGLQFIGRCLCVDVKDRPTISELLSHAFVI